jgi:ubiquitin carboxyl-terminal hydrolase 36/42
VSSCKSYERAKKKLKITEPPNVLTIALKRFQAGKFGKLNKLIRFPETLDLAPYVSGGSEKSHDYKLYGVIVHLDVMNAAFSGHYVCYIRNQNKWYKADDSTVSFSYIINGMLFAN